MLIKCIFYSAERNQLITYNPCEGLSAKGGKAGKRKEALTDQQAEVLLDAVKGLPPYLFVMIGLYAGLRREETLALQWDCVFLDEATPYISVWRAWRTEHNRPVVSTVLKTKAAKRDIPIPKCLVGCLREAKENSISDYVIADSQGEPLSYSQFQRVWKYVVVRSTKARTCYKYVNGQSIRYSVKPTLAEKYIMSNIHWHVKFDGSLQRKEIPEIPADAIPEALFNSFCHKDFGACQSNEVAIYKDRVEIYNPGSFPEGYKPEDFIIGDERPVRRNPLITSILYYSKDVESFGTGLKRIAEACKQANCRYEFKILKSGFVVVFHRSEDSKDVKETAGQDTVQVAGQVTVQELLAYCSVPRSRQEMQAFCKLTGRNNFSKVYLKPLLESGQLRMTIPEKPNSRNQRYIAVEGKEKPS